MHDIIMYVIMYEYVKSIIENRNVSLRLSYWLEEIKLNSREEILSSISDTKSM